MAMKRKVMIAVLVLVVMAASMVGIVYFSDGGDYPISVTGNLSTNDVKDIKAVVQHHLRKEIIPDISWSSIKGLPTAVRTYSKTHVLTIISVTNVVSEQWVVVSLGFNDSNGIPTSVGLDKWFRRGTNGWEWLGELNIVPD